MQSFGRSSAVLFSQTLRRAPCAQSGVFLRSITTTPRTNENKYKPTEPQTPSTWWKHTVQGPPDAILGITEAFNKDTSDLKMNLGVGAYRGDNGKPWVLPSVQMAERKIHDMDHEYAPITGSVKFCELTASLMFGDNCPALKEKRVVSSQAISGTGALRVLFELLRRYFPHEGVYVPKPTWANHIPILGDTGFDVHFYAYYDPSTCGLDFKSMMNDLNSIPDGSMVMFHACAHNPTGVDPTPDQWNEICHLVKKKKHFTFFDAAYQGFASGDPAKDAAPIRLFVKEGLQLVVAQSFAKNFGLYGHRVGAMHIVTRDHEEAQRVMSQLKIMIRPLYSNPPVHGARIVQTILSNPDLAHQWHADVQRMANRIIDMRAALVKGLEREGSKRSWRHITDQIGMFCYTGLKPEQVDELASKHHVYMTRDGRISIAGITTANVGHLAQAIHAVTK